MKTFAANIFLAVAWALAAGNVTLSNLAVGFALAFLVLWLVRPVLSETTYFGRVGRILSFFAFYLWELVLANLRVAYDVLTPRHHMRPGIIGIPLDAETDQEITLLANLITLTPGSLAVDVSADRKTLYVHEMFIGDLEQTRAKVKSGYERRVLELLR
jgi:multicomponent Na+:H+ antiporter subunit E